MSTYYTKTKTNIKNRSLKTKTPKAINEVAPSYPPSKATSPACSLFIHMNKAGGQLNNHWKLVHIS